MTPKTSKRDRLTKKRLSAADLAERALYRRAVEAVIWGMPAVNTDLMYQGMAPEHEQAGTRSWPLPDFERLSRS